MTDDDRPPTGPPFPGGKAAERRREQLAREFGEEPPTGEAEDDKDRETDESPENGSDSAGPAKE